MVTPQTRLDADKNNPSFCAGVTRIFTEDTDLALAPRKWPRQARSRATVAAGTPPVRARKARYYADPRLQERILPPPAPRPSSGASDADDWSGRPVPDQMPPEDEDILAGRPPDEPMGAGQKQTREFDAAHTPKAERGRDEHERKDPDIDPDHASVRARREFEDLQRMTRLAALDRDDGMEMEGP